MSTRVLRVSVLLLTLVGAIATAAEAQPAASLVATVPFEFVAGQVLLPAGTYEMTMWGHTPSVATIRSTSGRSVIVLTQNVSGREDLSQPELVFERIENQYFLARLVFSGREERKLSLPCRPSGETSCGSKVTISDEVGVR